MKKKKLNVIVVGLGVGEKHLNFLKKNNSIDKISVFDVKISQAKKIAKKNNINFFNKPQKIFKDQKINLAIVASPDDTHCEYILKSFKKKIHVFTEKPICNNLKELNKIVIQWKKNKNYLKFRSNLILRTSPLFLWLKNQIKSGYFGKIYSADVEYLYGRLNKFIKGWRGNAKEYSPMNGGGIHMIDLVCWLMNEFPYDVTSSGSKLATKSYKLRSDDFITSIFNFKSGLILKASANLACVYRHQHTIKIYGTKKTFIYDDLGPRIYYSRNPKIKSKKVNIQNLPTDKTSILKQFINDIEKSRNINYQTKFDLKVMNILCYCNIASKSKKKQKIKYLI